LFTLEAIRSKQHDLAVAANGGHLQSRISRLAGKSEPHEKSSWIPMIITVVLIIGMLITTSMAIRQESDISRPELEEKAINVEDEMQKSEYIITLPNGDTVRLLALFKPKENPLVFWAPDGTIIEAPKLRKEDFANANGRELAYVLQRPETKYKDGQEIPAPDGNFYSVHGWKKFQLESREPLVIKRASGYGQWVDMGRITEGQDLGNYHLTEVSELGEQILAKMFWKFNPDFGIRLVAVDKKGNEYQMEASDEFIGDFEEGQQMLYFQSASGLNKKQLSYFKLQRRPLFWAQFEEFALEPNALNSTKAIHLESMDNLRQNLRQLGLAWFMFVEDNDDNDVPSDFEEIKPYLEEGTIYSWLIENAVLLDIFGDYRDIRMPQKTPVAYDRTFLEKHGRRIVLFADGHVEIDSNDGSKELLDRAIKHNNRMESAVKLKYVGFPIWMWANEHDDVFPASIEQVEFEDEVLKEWAMENIEYIGAGKVMSEIEDTGKEVIAYDKNLSRTNDGTNLLFADGHVEYVNKDQLKDFIDIADDANQSQILTAGYLVSVPADMPELKGIVPAEGVKELEMIPPEKLSGFLAAVRANPQAKILSSPKLLTNDGHTGQINTKGDGDQDSYDLKIKSQIQPDGKSVLVDVDFRRYSHFADGGITSQSVQSTASILSGHAFALGGMASDSGVLLFLIQPTILENQSSVSSPPASGENRNHLRGWPAVSAAGVDSAVAAVVMVAGCLQEAPQLLLPFLTGKSTFLR
jgi:prepilin-type processing-associated H-X9-DG protein